MKKPYIVLTPNDFKKTHKVRVRKQEQVENHDNGFKLTFVSDTSGTYVHTIFEAGESYSGVFSLFSNKEDAETAGAHSNAQRAAIQNLFK